MTDNNNISRRGFLKAMGAGATVAAGVALESCTPKKNMATDPAGNYSTPVPTGKMTYRTNHNTGDKVSLLGYGCMRWPMIPNPNGQGEIIDQEQVNRLVDYAIEHGVNYFDTSPHYGRGQSEKATGIALKRHPRKSFYIATKLSTFLDGNGNDPNVAKAGYHRSFEELQVDYLDYYLIHGAGLGGFGPGGVTGMMKLHSHYLDIGLHDFLMQEKEAGRIRNMGFSYHGDIEVLEYLMQMHDKGEAHWDFAQIQMNYQDWHYPQGLNGVQGEIMYNMLAERNIPIVIMEPLLGGRLSNLPVHLVQRLKERNPENSVASWAFRWVGTHPQVMSVLSGMTYMEHLQDNIRSFSPLVPLTDEENEFLEETTKLLIKYPIIQCNNCQYCMPCPYGLDIPGTLLHYNKCVNEGNLPENQGDPNYRKMRQAFLVGYDRSVPKLRQASHCTGCNQCTPNCPQRINIPQQMQRIDQYVESLKQNTL
ncbi:MAG: aldo/keto reductase [Bacteroidaceae bacterium]|nr:aldo/keto reductase [Bacteroidaceae bacterium]